MIRRLMARKPPGRTRKSKSKARKPPPKCKAILLCDQAIIEANTGKISVIGIFERFVQHQFPGLTHEVTAFMQLIEGIGRYNLVIEVHDLQQEAVIARSVEFTVEFPDRLARINLVLPVPPLNLQHPGAYDFVLLADGQLVEQQKFEAVSPPDVEPDQHEN